MNMPSCMRIEDRNMVQDESKIQRKTTLTMKISRHKLLSSHRWAIGFFYMGFRSYAMSAEKFAARWAYTLSCRVLQFSLA